MGMFDTVTAPCPKCGINAYHLAFQSKGGSCSGYDYSIEHAPEEVMSDVNRHAPVKCPECKGNYVIMEAWNGASKYWVVAWTGKVEDAKRGIVPGYLGLQIRIP